MQFESFSAFVAMGGHGLYVWLSFAITLLILAYNLISPCLTERQLKQQLRRRLRRQEVRP